MILTGTTILVVVITTVIIHLYSNSNEEIKSYIIHGTKISVPARQFLSLDTIDSQTTMTSYTSEMFNLAYSALLDNSGSLTTKSPDNYDSFHFEANFFSISGMDSGTSKHNSNFSIFFFKLEMLIFLDRSFVKYSI